MKKDEKERNNNEQVWKIEKNQWTMMKKREQPMKHDEKDRKTMKNDEQGQEKMMKKSEKNNQT